MHLKAEPIPRNTSALDEIRPRPRTLFDIEAGPGALIALYSTTGNALEIYRRLRTTFPVIQSTNALILSSITPQPSAKLRARLEQCAFGPRSNPQIGSIVGKG